MGAINTVGVIGGGAWGTALALTAARAGRNVRLWARDPETVSTIRSRRQNTRYLPGITFDEDLNATESLEDIAGADAILLVTSGADDTCRAGRVEANRFCHRSGGSVRQGHRADLGQASVPSDERGAAWR